MQANQLLQYIYLMRLDKPIGILLLLWPTLWALWLASDGHPDPRVLFIFIAGVFLMRTAGCILNDLADSGFDKQVARTRLRPLATGKVSQSAALALALVLCAAAFALVLLCNALTIWLSLIGAGLAMGYPFLKRVTYFPQVGLGFAFTWGIPMAFAAINNSISLSAWFLFFTAILWPIIYDTLYAMVDKDDDIKIGVKSTAILFASYDKIILGVLQMGFIFMLIVVGALFHLQTAYYLSLLIVTALFVYQQWLIKDRDATKCFNAFLNNNWVGFVIFMGIYLTE